MHYPLKLAFVILAVASLCACGPSQRTLPPSKNQSTVTQYDIERDPARDVEAAVAEATQTNKRILLDVGGDWCKWCVYLDRFFADNPELYQYREEKFIWVKVNRSEENPNDDFLACYPDFDGVPHFFVLESDGTLLHSQDTAPLESGADSYSLEAMKSFLEEWAKK